MPLPPPLIPNVARAPLDKAEPTVTKVVVPPVS